MTLALRDFSDSLTLDSAPILLHPGQPTLSTASKPNEIDSLPPNTDDIVLTTSIPFNISTEDGMVCLAIEHLGVEIWADKFDEAVAEAKQDIVRLYQLLVNRDDSTLGIIPRKQKKAILGHIQAISEPQY